MKGIRQNKLADTKNYSYHIYAETNFITGVSGDVLIIAPGVTMEFTCIGKVPLWFWDGQLAETDESCYRSRVRNHETLNATATLTINGNHTCGGTFNVYCRIVGDSVIDLHHTTLTFQGWSN